MKQKAKRSPLPGILGLLALTGLVVVVALIVLLPGEAEEPAAGSSPAAAAGERAYLDALKAIDPGFVDNERAALNAGENICQEIESGKESDIVAKNAAKRFDAPEDQGADIVKAARTHLCP